MEGDPAVYDQSLSYYISIHALRVEGDDTPVNVFFVCLHFYPRPPGGGRPEFAQKHKQPDHFYPRPPGGGRHALRISAHCCRSISIHALRVEGDACIEMLFETLKAFLSTPSGWRATRCVHSFLRDVLHFYPRPPGGGRQQKRTKFSSVFAQKGEEFASLRRGKRKICRWRFKKDKFWVLIWCEGSGKSVCALASHCG